MPGRAEILSTGHIYHVFNKLIDDKIIFKEPSYCQWLLNLFSYYRSTKVSCSYSRFRELPNPLQATILRNLAIKKYLKVELLAFCLMPTHFHLLLKQRMDNGISKYVSDAINAFTRYYNVRNVRKGPLFLSRFKCVRIKSEPQLTHVSRYIHLNPYSSELIKNVDKLAKYPWSSYREYVTKTTLHICETETVMGIFCNHKKSYRQFVENHADHQRRLEYTKHAEKW